VLPLTLVEARRASFEHVDRRHDLEAVRGGNRLVLT
jgi:hypothetical protein